MTTITIVNLPATHGDVRTALNDNSTNLNNDKVEVVAGSSLNEVRQWAAETGDPGPLTLLLDRDNWVAIQPDGRFHGSPGVEQFLVYTVPARALHGRPCRPAGIR